MRAAVVSCPKLSKVQPLPAHARCAQAGFGCLGAKLGGASMLRGGLRVVLGGWTAMGITYWVGHAFNVSMAG